MSISLCFSTLGCADWSWSRILDGAAQWGYDGIELRSVNNMRDLANCPEFSPERINASLADVQGRGLRIACIGSDVRLTNTAPENLAHGKRYIEIAQGLESPFVRVFGGHVPVSLNIGEAIGRAAEKWHMLADYAESRGVMVLLETHDAFISSEKIKALFELTNHSAAGVIWDIHHPFRFEGENFENFWKNIGAHVRHVHIKDSRRDQAKFSYCLCGEGDVPVRETLLLLRRNSWSGWASVEWERPDIYPPEIVMPQYLAKLREYFG